MLSHFAKPIGTNLLGLARGQAGVNHMGTKQLIITITVALSQGQGVLWEKGEEEEDEGRASLLP